MPGSEAADSNAKEAAVQGILASQRDFGNDSRARFRRAFLSSWQCEWTKTHDKELREMKPSFKVW